MTAKTATVRLYVALASLLTALVTLLVTAVRLATSVVGWGVAHVEARTPAARPLAVAATPSTVTAPLAVALRVSAPTLHVVVSPVVQQLTTALIGLGFRAPDVRRAVASLGSRVEQAPLADLLKDGLRALSTAA